MELMQSSKDFKAWFMEERIERTISALKENGFDARYCASGSEACEEILKLIPSGSKVAVGGSATLIETGLIQKLESRDDIIFLNPIQIDETRKDFEEAMAKMVPIMRQAYTSDFFLCSSHAITEKGQLFNIDGNGNRVGAMVFGPKQVVIVAGQNKIVRDLEEAVRKVRYCTAPMGAKSISIPTPCTETGVCNDCNSPARICNIFVTIHKKPLATPVTIYLIGEEFGL